MLMRQRSGTDPCEEIRCSKAVANVWERRPMSANDDVAGWVIRVTTKKLVGGEETRMLYAVACTTPDNAAAVARARIGAAPDEKVEAVDRLGLADIQRLGLKYGQIELYQSTT